MADSNGLAWVLVVLVALGCSDSKDDGGAGAAGNGAGSDAASAAGDAGEAGREAGEAGSDAGEVRSDAGEVRSDAGGVCSAALAAGGGADAGPSTLVCGALAGGCGDCVSEKCCDLLERCGTDADCACMATCLGASDLGGIDGCLDSCGLDGSPPGYSALAECVARTCPDSDECSAPAGFAPPPTVGGGGPVSSGGIGSGSAADCAFDADLAFDPLGDVLQLQSADAGVCVRLERRNEGAGSMANTDYTLLDLRVGPLGEVVHIEGASAGCYYPGHHNFDDWAHGWSASRHYYVNLKLDGHGGARGYFLHTFEGGPTDTASCSPLADGVCPVGDIIELAPFP